jgi:hypothetical protein
MLTTLSALALSYAAATGGFAHLAIIGRGLVRAADQLLDGDYPTAGVEALAGIAAPAVIAYRAASGLVSDVADAALGLAGGVPSGPAASTRLVA